ncbi:hypothetical protein ABZ635_22040 [Nocardiopsis sp. NPDC007018]
MAEESIEEHARRLLHEGTERHEEKMRELEEIERREREQNSQ